MGGTLSLLSSMRLAEARKGFVPWPSLSVSVCKRRLNQTQHTLRPSGAFSLLHLVIITRLQLSEVTRPLYLPFFGDCVSGCRVNWFRTYPAKRTLCSLPWDQLAEPGNSPMAQLLNLVQGWMEKFQIWSWKMETVPFSDGCQWHLITCKTAPATLW